MRKRSVTAMEIKAATDKMGDTVEEPKKGKKTEKRKTQMREWPKRPGRPVCRARALARSLAAPGAPREG